MLNKLTLNVHTIEDKCAIIGKGTNVSNLT